jgi:hypothetical protein
VLVTSASGTVRTLRRHTFEPVGAYTKKQWAEFGAVMHHLGITAEGGSGLIRYAQQIGRVELGLLWNKSRGCACLPTSWTSSSPPPSSPQPIALAPAAVEAEPRQQVEGSADFLEGWRVRLSWRTAAVNLVLAARSPRNGAVGEADRGTQS